MMPTGDPASHVAEQRRLEALRFFAVLDTPRESGDESFCVHALNSPEVLVIPDAQLDVRVADYQCVRQGPIRFYAGAPLIADGQTLGTLCVADNRPRDLSGAHRRHLRTLAAQVVAQLVIRRQTVELAHAVRRMHDAKRMLDGVLKHTDVLIYAKDVEGRFVLVNPAVQEATRVAENMIGRTDHDLFDRDVADEYRRNDRRIMATGQRQVFTERIVRSPMRIRPRSPCAMYRASLRCRADTHSTWWSPSSATASPQSSTAFFGASRP